jgi:hypothetical protein
MIVESYLMSAARYFVHGNSNVANHVICLNPKLEHLDIFEEFYSPRYFDQFQTTSKISNILRSLFRPSSQKR